MLTKIGLDQNFFTDYQVYLDQEVNKSIHQLAKTLKGLKVAYISATASRGGVAELIRGAAPLFNNLGLDFSWHTLPHIPEQFLISRQFRDLFQGEGGFLTQHELKKYLDFNQLISAEVAKISADLVIISDYQPLAVPSFITDLSKKFVWQFHLDFHQQNKDPKFIDFLTQYLLPYKAFVFNTQASVPNFLNYEKPTFVIPPAIDPLKSKNQSLSQAQVNSVLVQNHISPDKPIILQVSRFNIWKNHQGVIDSFSELKKKNPALQLVFVSHLVNESDLEQVNIYRSLQKQAQKIPDVHFIVTNQEHNDRIVSALQSAATVIVQNSTREGFGLTVTEAMWKGKAVVGGDNSGIRAQIDHQKNGYIAENSLALSQHVQELLSDEALREKIEVSARQKVAENFLLPHFIHNFLLMLERTTF